jgi:hypothetical protein
MCVSSCTSLVNMKCDGLKCVFWTVLSAVATVPVCHESRSMHLNSILYRYFALTTIKEGAGSSFVHIRYTSRLTNMLCSAH